MIEDIFEKSETQAANYLTGIEESIRAFLLENNLTPAESYVKKLIELYEKLYLQQNVIILGKSFSGKTKAYQVRPKINILCTFSNKILHNQITEIF